MKHLLNTLIIVFITTTVAWSQNDRAMARIHAAKMAYITDRLQMSSEQSGSFIPLYNGYEREIKETRQSYLRKYKGANPAETSDAESLQFIDDNLDCQQAVIEIKRRYNDRFLKIISPQQLAELHKAENEFNKILLQRLDQRNSNGARNNRGNGY